MPQEGVRSHLWVRVDALGRPKTGALQDHRTPTTAQAWKGRGCVIPIPYLTRNKGDRQEAEREGGEYAVSCSWEEKAGIFLLFPSACSIVSPGGS